MGERETERENEHGLPNIASHKLQGEKEKRMVYYFLLLIEINELTTQMRLKINATFIFNLY